MLLGVAILLVLIAAGTVVWVTYGAPVIARLTGIFLNVPSRDRFVPPT